MAMYDHILSCFVFIYYWRFLFCILLCVCMIVCICVCSCVCMQVRSCVEVGSFLWPCGSQISNPGQTWWQTPFSTGQSHPRCLFIFSMVMAFSSLQAASTRKTAQWTPCVSSMPWASLWIQSWEEKSAGCRCALGALSQCVLTSVVPVHTGQLSFLTDTDGSNRHGIALPCLLCTSRGLHHWGILVCFMFCLSSLGWLYFADLWIICKF